MTSKFASNSFNTFRKNESGRIVAHENVYVSNGNFEGKGYQILRMKMQNAESYLKEDTVIYSFCPLAAGVPELTSKLEKLD